MLQHVISRGRLGAASILAVALGAAVTALPAAAHPTDQHARTAACTRSALQAGLGRGAEPLRDGARVIRPYSCDRGWATAGVITGGPDGVEVTTVFRAHGTRWQTTNRATACRRHQIPARLHRAACDSN